MGADSMVVVYGLRYSLGLDGEVDDASLEPFETKEDPRIRAASRAGLETWFGKVADGGEYFLLVGTILGSFGAEGLERAQFTIDELGRVATSTQDGLRQAALEGTPMLHVQFQADY